MNAAGPFPGHSAAAVRRTQGRPATPARWRALCASALFAAAGLAHADPALMSYEVRAGDTLYHLAQRYLESPEDWRVLARLNRVADPRRLTIGATLLIPADRLRGVASQATVLYLKGLVVAGEPARELQVGDRLDEGTALRVHEGAFVGLALADGSTLHLPALTQLTLERLRESDGIGGHQNTLKLDRGRVDSRVRPQPEGSRFDVRTPLAVAGVRGTQFGVGLSGDGARAFSDVTEGRVAVASSGLPQAAGALGAGQGAVVTSPTQPPRVLPLLPAPELGAGELRVERMPHALTLPPLPGAVAYRVQVDEGAQGDAPARVLFDAVEAGAPPRLIGLPDGGLRVRVRAIDAEGLMGAEATALLRVKATPIAPLVRSPKPNAEVATGTVELRCTEVPGAIAYDLQVSSDPTFSTLLAEARQSAHCAFEVRIAEPGALYWRVASVAQSVDGGPDRGPFSDPSPLAAVPPPSAPGALEQSEDGLRLHWAGAPGHRHRVKLASDEAFGQVLQDVEVDVPSVRFDLRACQSYFVRLRTLAPNGLASAFSAPRRVSASAGLCSQDGAPVRSLNGEAWDTRRP
jgi:hypothetical protein